MALRFTQITAKLKYPPNIRGQLSTLHSDVITYVCSPGVFTGNYMQKHQIVRTLNTLSFCVINGTQFLDTWDPLSPLDTCPEIDDDLCKHRLGDMYIHERGIQWDVEIVDSIDSDIENRNVGASISESNVVVDSPATTKSSRSTKKDVHKVISDKDTDAIVIDPTAKEDLYIQSPKVPRFNTSLPWKEGVVDGTAYVIYTSEPRIPQTQTDISATTDLGLMTCKDLMRLFPNRFIQTRASIMYTPIPKIPFHDKLGVILPIEGYSYEQVVDNIIRYPHIFRLTKQVGDTITSFYSSIEIQGQLYNIKEYWYNLPESKIIPFQVEFLKEYVVRRYLLERDLKNIKHKFPIMGNLDPFLTLFTTTQDYVDFGYKDLESLARRCVLSRVAYKQSRNPILRRLNRA